MTKFIKGHNSFGRRMPIATRIKLSIERTGRLNPHFGKPTSLKQKEIAGKILRKNNPMSKPEIRALFAGENCHFWRGGITPLNLRLREIYQYRVWRNSVFNRDKGTCRLCKSATRPFHADHIVPFSFLLKKHQIKSEAAAVACAELWDINNGRTLCVPCHRKTDTFGVSANRYVEPV